MLEERFSGEISVKGGWEEDIPEMQTFGKYTPCIFLK